MKVSNSEVAANQKKLNTLNSQLQVQISNREKDIKETEQQFNERMAKVKDDNAIQLYKTQTFADQRQLEVLTEKEEKLINLKENLELNTKRLMTEQEKLKESNASTVKNIKEHFEERYTQKFEDGITQISKIEDTNSDYSKKIQIKSNEDLNTLDEKLAISKQALSQANSDKAEYIESSFIQNMSAKEKLHDKLMYSKDKEFKTLLDRVNAKQASKITQVQDTNQKELSDAKINHRDLMRDKQTNFDAKFEQLTNNHQQVIDGIKSRFDKDLEDLVFNYSQTKSNIIDRSDDSFYKVSSLDPSIIDFGDFYELSLDIPEHESNNVQVSAEQRNLKISMTRKFSEDSKDIYGDTDISKRTESFTKKIKVDSILNKRGISQKYENGTLYFRIAKM